MGNEYDLAALWPPKGFSRFPSTSHERPQLLFYRPEGSLREPRRTSQRVKRPGSGQKPAHRARSHGRRERVAVLVGGDDLPRSSLARPITPRRRRRARRSVEGHRLQNALPSTFWKSRDGVRREVNWRRRAARQVRRHHRTCAQRTGGRSGGTRAPGGAARLSSRRARLSGSPLRGAITRRHARRHRGVFGW